VSHLIAHKFSAPKAEAVQVSQDTNMARSTMNSAKAQASKRQHACLASQAAQDVAAVASIAVVILGPNSSQLIPAHSVAVLQVRPVRVV
jgi:hypothetical protein